MASMEQGLRGSWTHSFEEDTSNEQVFRPTDTFSFPPSRRPRATIDFNTGQMVTAVAGPDDKLQRSVASMTPLGMQRYRLGEGREIEVVDAGRDMLKIRASLLPGD
jgi:hypothetical protein